MSLHDQHGQQWVVEAGDPARVHVNTLTRQHFAMIVLPEHTFVTGELALELQQPDMSLAIQYRMADCLEVLCS